MLRSPHPAARPSRPKAHNVTPSSLVGARRALAPSPRARAASNFVRRTDVAALAPPAPAPTAEPTTSASTPAPEFSWAKHWYPVYLADDVPKGKDARPVPFTLLGEDFVLWHDGSQFVASSATCPHRLAPMAQGRVEGGRLCCSYHGWEFDAAGACTRIPQPCGGADGGGTASALASPRSCLLTRPAIVDQGLVWVWGDGGPTAAADAAAARPKIVPGIAADDPTRSPDGARMLYMGHYTKLDVPCSWASLVDNGLDPSHLDFAHTGVIGDRHGPHAGIVTVAPVDASTPPPPDRPFGAAGAARALATAAACGDAAVHDATFPMPDRGAARGKQLVTQRIVFEPPTTVSWLTDDPADVAAGAPYRTLGILATPTRPGWCRVFFVLAFPDTPAVSPFARALFGALPRWHLHLRGGDVFDGDVALLAPADAAGAAATGGDASYAAFVQSNYMPADADAPVRDFRRWLAERGGGGPFGAGEPAALAADPAAARAAKSRAAHLETCEHCRRAHGTATVVGQVAAALALLLAAGAAGAVGARAPAAAVARYAVGAAVSAGVAVAARRFGGLFVKGEYDHARVK